MTNQHEGINASKRRTLQKIVGVGAALSPSMKLKMSG